MEMIGWATDNINSRNKAAASEERRALPDRMRLQMVPIEARNLFARSEQEWDPLMQRAWRTSRIRRWPVEAAPPACSISHAMGLAS